MKKPPIKRLKIRVYRLFFGTSLALFFRAKQGEKSVHNFSEERRCVGV
jgi:hypothetical protein